MSYTTWTDTRKAAKPHQCDWCYTPIERGEAHIYSRQADGSAFFAWRTHLDCAEAAIKSWNEANSMDGDPACQEWHTRGKTCEETPCLNAQRVPTKQSEKS